MSDLPQLCETPFSTAIATVAAAAVPRACVHPRGPSGVQPSNWLTTGMLINVPMVANEPAAVSTTSGARESSSV